MFRRDVDKGKFKKNDIVKCFRVMRPNKSEREIGSNFDLFLAPLVFINLI